MLNRHFPLTLVTFWILKTLSIFEIIILNRFYQIEFLENADLGWTKRALCKSNVPFNLKMHKQAPRISDKRSQSHSVQLRRPVSPGSAVGVISRASNFVILCELYLGVIMLLILSSWSPRKFSLILSNVNVYFWCTCLTAYYISFIELIYIGTDLGSQHAFLTCIKMGRPV